MAKQAGSIHLEGRIGNLRFYKMGDDYYVRTRSSLTGKRVKKDPAFRLTMVYAGLMGQASKLASEVYRQMDKTQKGRKVYQQLAGKAFKLLKAGMPAEVILTQLKAAHAAVTKPGAITVVVSKAPVQKTSCTQASSLTWVEDMLAELFFVMCEDGKPP